MSPSPVISVIMAVFDQEAYVEEAVQSVLDQTYCEWELLVVNDGSMDSTPLILEKLAERDARIRLFHQANRGPSAARNRAIGEARGQWIAYLDGDDLWFPDTVQAYVEHVHTRPEAQFVFGHCHRLEGDRVTLQPGRPCGQVAGSVELFERIFVCPSSICHCKNLWVQAGGFDPRLRICEDYDLFLRMSLHCEMESIGVATGLRRRHASNLSKQSGQCHEVEAEILREFAEAHPDVIHQDIANRRLHRVFARAARGYHREGDYASARHMAETARQYGDSFRITLLLLWTSILARVA